MSIALKSRYGDIFQNNQEFDEVFQDSLRLENKVNQNGTTIEKELERVDILINNYDDSNVLKRKEKSFKKSCKCQHGKKCTCGKNCRCISLKNDNNKNKKQKQSNFKGDDDSLSLSRPKKKNWSLLWSKKKKIKQKDIHFSKSQSLKGNKRTHLKGELSPNSPKDKEMIEIFTTNNDKHSIQNRLVFPDLLLTENYNKSNNDIKYKERSYDVNDGDNSNHTYNQYTGRFRNRKDKDIYSSQTMLCQQQKRESFASSEDYSIFKLQNSNNSNKSKNHNRNEETKDIHNDNSNLKPSEIKEKRNILDKIWSSFRFKSSKIPQIQSEKETYPNVEALYFELNDEMGQSNITTNVNNFLLTEPHCLLKDKVGDISKKY